MNLPPLNQPTKHSHLALTELPSPNLAPSLLLDHADCPLTKGMVLPTPGTGFPDERRAPVAAAEAPAAAAPFAPFFLESFLRPFLRALSCWMVRSPMGKGTGTAGDLFLSALRVLFEWTISLQILRKLVLYTIRHAIL